MDNLIRFKNVFKTYGKKKILEDINLDLPQGKFITLIGCNGAGKSTTLRLIAGLEEVSGGDLTLFNENPFSYHFNFKSDIFFIHENFQINLDIRLIDFVKSYRYVFPRWDNKIFNKIAKDRKISLKKTFKELSRGQKMQFLLMMAFAARPKLLLLDEITSVIDIDGQRYFLDMLKDYTQNGGTVLITTNILSELNAYTDHLVLLQDTKLKLNKEVSELQKDYVILEKKKTHPIFLEKVAVQLQQIDSDSNEIYLVPIELYKKYDDISDCFMSRKPRLEDILVFHFKFKENNYEENLVA